MKKSLKWFGFLFLQELKILKEEDDRIQIIQLGKQ